MTASEWRAVSGPCALADQHPAVDTPLRRVAQDLAVPRGEIVRRLFGARVIDDGAGMIRLSVPHVAQRDVPVPLSVEVNWSLVLTKAVARLYLIADGNGNPLLSSVSLIPDLVPPHVCINVRLETSTDVRAVVECGDGTLLQVRRWVRVRPHDPNAGDVNGAAGAQLDRRADRT